MPIDDSGVGYSEWTYQKQDIFRGIMRKQLREAHGAMIRNHWMGKRYYYFDLTAGPGVHPEYGVGSPIIFLQEAEELRADCPGFDYNALMLEIDKENFDQLTQNLENWWHATAWNIDHKEALAEYCIADQRYKNAPGLIYSDPTKAPNTPFDILKKFSRHWQRCDILLAVSAASLKRVRHLDNHKYLMEHLAEIEKKKWIVRTPFSKFQWTFLLGTNWIQMNAWNQAGFFSTTTDEGRAILASLNSTRDELKTSEQPPLFDL